MLRLAVVLILVIGGGSTAAAGERVDLELVLLADASRSIDDGEIRLQRQGYAVAITHPDVLAAIAYGYERRIAVTCVEWGEETSQEVVVPWTLIDGPKSTDAFARDIVAARRRAFGPNAIGSALAFAQALIQANDIAGTRRVIDFSADSAWSGGGVPILEARAAALAR